MPKERKPFFRAFRRSPDVPTDPLPPDLLESHADSLFRQMESLTSLAWMLGEGANAFAYLAPADQARVLSRVEARLKEETPEGIGPEEAPYLPLVWSALKEYLESGDRRNAAFSLSKERLRALTPPLPEITPEHSPDSEKR